MKTRVRELDDELGASTYHLATLQEENETTLNAFVRAAEAVDRKRAERYAREDAAFRVRIGSPENAEAIKAFFEKRKPDFTGLSQD